MFLIHKNEYEHYAIDQNILHLIDLDDTQLPESVDLSCESELILKSVETSAAEDLRDLRLTEPSLSSAETEIVPKSPLIQSHFKNMPSMIYFSTKNEPGNTMGVTK